MNVLQSSHSAVLVAPDKDATSRGVPQITSSDAWCHTQEWQDYTSQDVQDATHVLVLWFRRTMSCDVFGVDNFKIDTQTPVTACFVEKPRAESGLIGVVADLFKHYHTRIPRQEHKTDSIHSLKG
jgi:hypothetical protein